MGKLVRLFQVSIAPLKSLPMNLFVMYMSGNSISIFPIMMVAMMAWRPLKACMAVGTTFKGYFINLVKHYVLRFTLKKSK